MKIKNKSFSDKSKKWLKRHLEDEYVIKSSKDNFRSRAAYKLIEIIEKYRLLDGLEKALDIGSAPGSWSEVLKSRGKNLKKIVALDLLDMNPIRNVDVYKVDFLSDKCSKILAKYAKGDSHLKIVAGFMDGKVLEANEVAKIATLPTLDEARAKIVGILSAPAQNILSILLAPGSKIAILAHEKSKKG